MKVLEVKTAAASSRALVFPARISAVAGKPVFYLFSIRQVAEVLTRVDIYPVPFAPPHALGVAQWRDKVLPIISLDHCLGANPCDNQMPLQAIVVRSVSRGRADNLKELYAVCMVGAGVQQMDIPPDSKSIAVPGQIKDASGVYGVYEMPECVVMVINIEKILKATDDKKATCINKPY